MIDALDNALPLILFVAATVAIVWWAFRHHTKGKGK